MADDAQMFTCPNCRTAFVPPAGFDKFFCPACGTRVERQNSEDVAASAAQRSQDKTQQAAELALQAVQQAVELAQAGASREDTQAAFAAAQQAMEAAKAAQAAQTIVAQAQAAAAEATESARLARENQERFAAEAAKREAEQRKQAEEQARRAEAERLAAEQRAREEEQRRQAETQARAQAQAQAAAASRPQSSAPVEYHHNTAVRCGSTGYGLFTVTLPSHWVLDEASLIQNASGSRPYNGFAQFSHKNRTMSLTLGDAGQRLSAGMKAMMAQYGSAIAGVDRTNYAEMAGPRKTADDKARQVTSNIGATGLSLVAEYGSPNISKCVSDASHYFERASRESGAGAILRNPFASELIHMYRFDYNGHSYKMAVYVRLYAIKDGSGVDMMSPVGLAFGLGSAVGNLFKKKKSAKQGAAQGSGRTSDSLDSNAKTDGRPLYSSDLEAYLREGTIFWDVQGLATLITPEEFFETDYQQAFIPLISTYQLHPDIIGLATNSARQQTASIQGATNAQIQQMNRQAQASMEAARQAQAAADARFEAWQRQSDAHHAAFRERTNAQFSGSGYGGSSAPDFSEAIRGVNTYTTSDGREVEVDVSADRAYENQAGDVMGWSSAFEPGSDWTEIPRS